MQFLNNMIDVLANPAVIAVSSMVLESLLRFAPTAKPASVLYIASDGLKLASQGVNAVAQFLDKVLPQRLKPAADVSAIVPPNPPAG